MLTYVENGSEFTLEFGHINEAFYNTLESVLNEMAQLFLCEGAKHYPRFREHVRREALENSCGIDCTVRIIELVSLFNAENTKEGKHCCFRPPSAYQFWQAPATGRG